MDPRTIITANTYVTNFNADGQSAGIELMTDERGHMYPIAHLFQGNAAGDELAVTSSNQTGNVIIKSGYIQIPFSDYAYLGWLDTDTQFHITASTSGGARYVAIVAYINRGIQYDNSVTNNPGLLTITEVAGTAATTPLEVSDSAIRTVVGDDNPFVVLAQVYLPMGATAISASNIIDKRQKLGLKQGTTLPEGSYASGIKPAAGSTSSNPLQFAVINANDPVPTGSDEYDLLVCRIAQ